MSDLAAVVAHGAGVAGGVGGADGVAVVVAGGLGENTAELGFADVGGGGGDELVVVEDAPDEATDINGEGVVRAGLEGQGQGFEAQAVGEVRLELGEEVLRFAVTRVSSRGLTYRLGHCTGRVHTDYATQRCEVAEG